MPDTEEKILNMMKTAESVIKFDEKHKINNEYFENGLLR